MTIIFNVISSIYHLLTSQDPPLLHTSDNLIWHSKVHVKVSILAWLLLRDRVLTKDNLLGRDIITGANTSCLAGCGQVETTQHLFLQCDISSSLWQQVRSWVGVSGVDHQSIPDHFVHFTNYFGGLRERRSFMQLIWLICV